MTDSRHARAMVTALWLVGGLAGCECGASETATPTPEAPAPATPAAVDVPVDDWIDIPRPAFDGGCFDAQRNAAVRDVVCGGLRARVSAAQVQWADDVTAEPIVALRRIGEDEWVFVTRDGLAHHAASFVGALETRPRASGSIDRADFERERLQAPHGDPTITPRWIDDRARAWALSADGEVTRVAGSVEGPIADIAFAGERALVLEWPSRVVQVVGETGRAIDLGEASPLAVSAVDGWLFVTTTAGIREIDATGAAHPHDGPLVAETADEGPYDEATFARLTRASWDRFPGVWEGGPSVWGRAVDPARVLTAVPEDCQYALHTAGGFRATCGADFHVLVSTDGEHWERDDDALELAQFGDVPGTWLRSGRCDGTRADDDRTYCWHSAAGEREVHTTGLSAGMLGGDAVILWAPDGAGPSLLAFADEAPAPLARPGAPGTVPEDATLTASGELVMRYARDGRSTMSIGPHGGPYVEHALPDGATDVAFADARHGVAARQADASAWTTSDGGATWAPLEGERSVEARELWCGAHACMTGAGLWGAPAVVRRWGAALGTHVIPASRDRRLALPSLARSYDCTTSGDRDATFTPSYEVSSEGPSIEVSWWPLDGDGPLRARGAIGGRADDLYLVAGTTHLIVLGLRGSLVVGAPDGALTTLTIPPAVDGPEIRFSLPCARQTTADQVSVELPGGALVVSASGIVASRVYATAPCRTLDGRDASGVGRALACTAEDPLPFARLDGTTTMLPPLGTEPLAFCDPPNDGATELVMRLYDDSVSTGTYTDADEVIALGPNDRWCVRAIRVAPRGGIDPGFGALECVLPRIVVTGADGTSHTLGATPAPWSCHLRQ